MRIGIVSDTHDQIERTRKAIALLRAKGAEVLVHCGDIVGPGILAECATLPLYFVFGNRDCDTVPELQAAAREQHATCLGWGGAVTLAGRQIAVVHGHLTMDLRPLLQSRPDYLLSGHSHIAAQWDDGGICRINPGALAEADEYSVALLDLNANNVEFICVP